MTQRMRPLPDRSGEPGSMRYCGSAMASGVHTHFGTETTERSSEGAWQCDGYEMNGGESQQSGLLFFAGLCRRHVSSVWRSFSRLDLVQSGEQLADSAARRRRLKTVDVSQRGQQMARAQTRCRKPATRSRAADQWRPTWLGPRPWRDGRHASQ